LAGHADGGPAGGEEISLHDRRRGLTRTIPLIGTIIIARGADICPKPTQLVADRTGREGTWQARLAGNSSTAVSRPGAAIAYFSISFLRDGAMGLRRPGTTGRGQNRSSGQAFAGLHTKVRWIGCTLRENPGARGFGYDGSVERTPAWQRQRKELLQHLVF
jgi:hypothetical protein